MTELSDNNGILLNHYTIKPVRVKNVVYGLDIRDHNHLEEKWNIFGNYNNYVSKISMLPCTSDSGERTMFLEYFHILYNKPIFKRMK